MHQVCRRARPNQPRGGRLLAGETNLVHRQLRGVLHCTQSVEGRQASELGRRTSTWRLANHERSRRLSRRCTCGAAGSRAARVVGDTVEHGLGKQYDLFLNSRAERDERCGERVLAVGKKSIRGVGLLSGSRTSKSRNIRAHGRDCVNIPSRSKCFTCPPCFRRRHLRYRSRLCGDRVGRVSGSVGVVGSPHRDRVAVSPSAATSQM